MVNNWILRAALYVGYWGGDAGHEPWAGYLYANCSGYQIAPSTAMSAAHCFYENIRDLAPPNAVHSGWYPPPVLAHGVVTRRQFGGTSTWENPVITSQWSYLPPTDCYMVSVYPVWMEPLDPGEFGPPLWSDYAVIDFDPGGLCFWTPPGYFTGYASPAYGVYEFEYTQAWPVMAAHDGGKASEGEPPPPGVMTDPTKNFAKPSVVTRGPGTTGAMRWSADTTMIYHTLDTVGATSGGNIRANVRLALWGDTYGYYVGTNTGPIKNDPLCPAGFGRDNYCNRAVRFNANVRFFLEQSSRDF